MSSAATFRPETVNALVYVPVLFVVLPLFCFFFQRWNAAVARRPRRCRHASPQNLQGGPCCVCGPFAILTLPTSPSQRRDRSADASDDITFPARRWGLSPTTAGQKWVRCIIAMATERIIPPRGGKNVTGFRLGEE